MNKFDLEERLIWFAVRIIELSNHQPDTKAGNHLSEQIVRSVLHQLLIMEKLKVLNHLGISYIRWAFVSRSCEKHL